MKVKHLVYIGTFLIAIFVLLSKFIFPNAELYFAEKKIAAGKIEDKQEILELLKETPIESKKWDIIQDYMIDEGVLGGFDIYISPTMQEWGETEQTTIHFTKDEKIPFLIDYVKHAPANGYLVTAAKVLSLFYEKEGDIEKAKKVLYDTSKRFVSENYRYDRNELLIQRIRLTMNHGQFDEVNHYIVEIMESLDRLDLDMHAQIAQIRAEMLLQEGELDQAIEVVEQAIKDFEEGYEEEQEQWGEVDDQATFSELENRVYYDQLKSLKRTLINAHENNSEGKVVTVSGKVLRSDGTPVEGVGVYLRDKINVNRSVSPDEIYQVVTDREGRYEFHGVIPNNYQITLGFHYEQITGWTWSPDMYDWIDVDGSKDVTYDVTLQKLIAQKSPVNQEEITGDVVHFEWEEVEGAAYYGLFLAYEIDGGSISMELGTHIKDSTIDVKVEEIYNTGGGTAFGPEDAGDGKSMLAFTNPENRLSWSVTAYDKNNRVITESIGYRLNEDAIGNLPLFYLKQRELTKADKLLMDNKAEKALEQYLSNYDANPNDSHSIRMIIRLIGIKGDSTVETRDILAIPYMEKLALQSTNPKHAFDVVRYYYDNQKWETFNHWMDTFFSKEGQLTDYEHSIYASALMKQGKHDEASMEFEKALKKGLGNQFVGYWLANDIYRTGLSKEVVAIAKNYPEKFDYEETPNWSYRVNQLIEESKNYKIVQYEQELRRVLDMYFTGKEQELKEWINTTNKTEMKMFIMAVRNVS